MYRHFIRNPKGIALVAKDESTQAVAGVAIGCEYPRRFYRGLALAMLPAYIWSSIIRFFSRDSLGVGATKRYQHQDRLFPSQDIVYFTQVNVSPDFQKRLVGSLLSEAMYEEARRRGHCVVYLITDRDNAPMRALQARMGSIVVREFKTPSGISRCLYLKELEAPRSE